MNWKAPAVAGLLFTGAAIATAGCATVAAGTTQDIRIVSDPQGAQCQITRDGAVIASATTPALINVPRSKRDMTATCKVAGMDDVTETIPSYLQGGTVGNIIAGGLIGIAVDAASGANNNYLELTIVVFAPNRFDSEASRDAYFAELKKRVDAAVVAEVKRIMDSCPQSKKEFCAVEADRARESRTRGYDAVEARRSAAKIGS